MASIQIPKSQSVSFNEYLYDIINNTSSSFASGWGFFVSIDEEPNKTNKTKRQNNYSIKPVMKRKDSIKSFPSLSNLQEPSLQSLKLQTSKLQDIDEITETIFDMNLSDIDNNNNYVVSKYNYNLPINIYNNIKTNIYFIGTVILYGSIACIKSVIAS
jgi:nitrous oxide reductase